MSSRRPVSIRLLESYAIGIDSYFVEHEGEPAPADLEVFRRSAEYARDKARARGELDDLRAVVDYVLACGDSVLEENFDLSLSELVNSENAQTEECLRRILFFYRSVIWPDADPVRAGQPPAVDVVDVPLERWRRERVVARGE